MAMPLGPGVLLSSIFSATALEFKRNLPEGLTDAFAEIYTLEDLEHAIQDIEVSQAGRKSLRYLNKIKPCLHALNDYSKTIEVFVNAKPDIMAFVWGPIKVCLLIASKYEKAFDALLSTYVKIKAALPHFSAIEQLFETNPQIQLVLGNVYKDVLSIHLRALNFFTRPGWSIALRITCRALEDMFDDVFSNLERSKELLYSSASIAHYQAAQVARQQIETMFKSQQEAARAQKRDFILGWLNPAEHHELHEQLCDLRGEYPQTTKWIYEEPCWKNWLSNEQTSGRVFCISGIPGAGKTMIFSSVVEHLISKHTGNKLCAVAYVYCKYNDGRRNTFTELVRSLIHQLVGDNDACGDYLFDVATHSVERTANKREVLITILKDVMQCYEEVFIGIDGLDECEKKERATVIRLLKELLKLPAPSPNLHLFITGRAELDIEKFMTSALYHVRLGPKHLANDILYYVERRTAELARFDLNKQQMRDLNDEVSARSAGMFLLARLIFDLFERCVSQSDFEEEYVKKGVPSGIDEAYGRILAQVREREKESGRTRARVVLEILSCARRKLYVHELQGMLSMDTTSYRMDLSKGRYRQHFKEICGPLVELHLDGTVDLAHQTVKEYLDQYHSEYVSLETAAMVTTKICTSYLSLDAFNSTHEDKRTTEAALNGDYAFHRYAILEWLPHIHSLPGNHTLDEQNSIGLEEDVQKIHNNLSSFSTSTFYRGDVQSAEGKTLAILLEMLEAMYKDLWQGSGEGRMKRSAILNLTSVTDENSPVIQQISRIQTAIENALASEIGREKVSLLKEAYGNRPYHCSSPSCTRFLDGFSTSQERNTHLQNHERQYLCGFQDCEFSSVGFPTKRSLETHHEIFHLESLLPQFSDLKFSSIWTTLEESIGTDDEALVESLCVEAERSSGRPTGLVAKAITKAHFNSARVLARHFHSPSDFEDKSEGLKVLGALAEANQLSLTREILLLCPALPWEARVYQSVLLKNIGKAHKDMVTLLLDQLQLRVDPYWSYRTYAQLIKEAGRSSNWDGFPLILDTAAKRCTASGLGHCCTQLAAEGHSGALKRVLAVLFQNFAEDVKQMKRIKSLQHLSIDDAAMRLTQETIKYSKDGEGSSFRATFQLAAYRGVIDELSRQLELGIDINDSSGVYGTALQAASKKGDVQVVRWLLDRGAHSEIPGGEYGNAVAAAAAKGHVEVLEILLAIGANPSQEARAKKTQGRNSMKLSLISSPSTATPLHFAAAEMQVETAQVLARVGADITAIDSNGNTALHMCVLGPYTQGWYCLYATQWGIKSVAVRMRRSCVTIASLLLEQGAVATVQNKSGNSALHLLFIDEHAEIRLRRHEFVDHPCAVQLAKLLVEAGADFDQENNAGVSAREAAIDHGGQVLEDLKREIPSVWEGFEESVGGGATNLTSSLVEPVDISKNSSPDLSSDQEIPLFWEGETIAPDDFYQDNASPQPLDIYQNFGNPSENIGALYTPPDSMPWKAGSCPETVLYSSSVTFEDYLAMGETHQTGNDINAPRNDGNLPTNNFVHSTSDLFMNPWRDT